VVITYGEKSLKNLMMLMLSVLLATGAMVTGSCVGKAQIIENVTPQEAFALIQENQDNPNFVIIDMRHPESFAREHIENAINIEYYPRTFQDELNQLDKDKTYLIYSGSVCGGIGPQSLSIMEELNFKEVYNMTGGCIGWKLEGFPTVGEGANQ